MKLIRTSVKASLFGAIACLALSQTGCLKTRAQLKGDQDQSGDVADGDAGTKAPGVKPSNYELDEIRNEVTRVSGRLEEIDHNQRSQPNATDLKEYATRLDARVSELEKNQMLVMTELKALKDKQSTEAASAKQAATPPSDLLTRGNQQLAERKCDDAEATFRQLLGRNLKSKDAAEAHYGLGEAQYCKKEYKKAILEYSAVRKASSKSSKVPASLYKIGLAFSHLNMTEEAKGFFNEVIEKYPNSSEAKRARAKVKE